MYPAGLDALLDILALRTLLGTPVRIYPFGEAPATVVAPYVVHQLVVATPENCLDDPPPIDDERIQFTVWANEIAEAVAVAVALRTVLQDTGYINGYSTNPRDQDTKRYGVVLDWSRLVPWPSP